MEGTTCNKFQPLCKIITLVLLVILAWSYLAFDRHAVWPGKCTGVNMKVEGGEVKAAQLQNDHLILTVAFPEQKVTKVILYDYCKGTVLSSIEAK